MYQNWFKHKQMYQNWYFGVKLFLNNEKFNFLSLNIISWHLNKDLKALGDMIPKESCTHIKVKNEHASVLITKIIF